MRIVEIAPAGVRPGQFLRRVRLAAPSGRRWSGDDPPACHPAAAGPAVIRLRAIRQAVAGPAMIRLRAIRRAVAGPAMIRRPPAARRAITGSAMIRRLPGARRAITGPAWPAAYRPRPRDPAPAAGYRWTYAEKMCYDRKRETVGKEERQIWIMNR